MTKRVVISTFPCLLSLLADPAFGNENITSKMDSEIESGIESISVTANRRVQDLQEVSSFITAINDETLERLDLTDITGIETLSAGLRLGRSGDELRPAMRGARTNEVGVAGTGIAEQVVGLFIDDVYIPTTTSALGTLMDLQRIEVLRGPQGTLYGRNTFAGSINIISKQPEFDSVQGDTRIAAGNYQYRQLQSVVNVPLSDNLASRFAFATEKRDGLIANLHQSGTQDDLREKDNWYLRAITLWQPDDEFELRFRLDYSHKDANSDAIWGYQQIAGYQLLQSTENPSMFEPVANLTQGHIYQPANAANTDLGPYQVFRNAESFSRNNQFTATIKASWLMGELNIDWITAFNRFSGQQFYDNDYSDGGFDDVGGFGRQDDQEAWSSELKLVSDSSEPFQWIAGLYAYDQEADWEWLWRDDIDSDGVPDVILVPGWGNPEHDPHKVRSLAAYGQGQLELSQDTRLILGARYQRDKKSFTGSATSDWQDNAFLYKAALEYDLHQQHMFYASVATGYRTGGANDPRVIARGAPDQYGNEEVVSYELGFNNLLDDGGARLNLALFANRYDDVKAQLFAVACNDPQATLSVSECVNAATATTFEYYENGGNVSSWGLEVDAFWQPQENWEFTANLALLNTEFDDGFLLGNSLLRPYEGPVLSIKLWGRHKGSGVLVSRIVTQIKSPNV